MKLSKQSLMNALILATEKTANFMFAGAQNALHQDTLEIEGYVRADHIADTDKMVWTKFDPNDPKTFPPDKDFFLVYYNNKYVVCVCWYVHQHEDRYKHLFAAPSGDLDFTLVSHWRPLPKPPVETEVGK